MNVSAVSTVTLCGLSAAGLFWSAAALAHDAPRAAPQRLAQANPCAIYGSGYVTVHGGAECAQIRGRVRLESDAAAPMPPMPSSPHEPGFGPASALPSDGAGRAHLRVPGGAAYAPELPRTR